MFWSTYSINKHFMNVFVSQLESQISNKSEAKKVEYNFSLETSTKSPFKILYNFTHLHSEWTQIVIRTLQKQMNAKNL